MTPTFIEVRAGVLYWEDADINGKADTEGTLTPFRVKNSWCPTIRLADGQVMGWPAGVVADIHFKVCDDGEYWLLDEHLKRVAKWTGFYVPNDFLCHGDNGYGDYVILVIDADGRIQNWRQPVISWACDHVQDDGSVAAWKKLEGVSWC